MGGRGGSSGLQRNQGPAYLGKQGKPKTMAEAMAGTNPHFSEGKEWRKNCQRCIYAYEMQRRGYEVEAKPRIFDGTDTLPYMYDQNGWTKVMEGATLVDMPSRNTVNEMLDQMYKWGDGARAVVRVAWKGRRSGHVFIAEQEGMGTVFVDPQTGNYVDIDFYMNNAIKGETKLMRIDNLKPGPLLEKCVKRKGS